jgi:hypothetical protein
MKAKIKIIGDPIKNPDGDSATFEVEAWDTDISPVSLQIVAPFDWFDSKQKFLINLRSYVENRLQNVRNKRAKRDKMDIGIQMIKDNIGKEIDLSTIDLGGAPEEI